MCVQQSLIGQFPITRVTAPDNLASPWYARFLVCYICLIVSRVKYYFIWKVAEGTSILAGFGFRGYDNNGNAIWSGISNVDVFAFETASVSGK